MSIKYIGDGISTSRGTSVTVGLTDNGLPPVVVIAQVGHFGYQDYLTPDEADALADKLIEGAATVRGRELAKGGEAA